MVQDRLSKAVLRRFKELGLPSCLIDVSEFRENFFFHGWVMFVRDGDPIADVHLVQPQPDKSLTRERAEARQARKGR